MYRTYQLKVVPWIHCAQNHIVHTFRSGKHIRRVPKLESPIIQRASTEMSVQIDPRVTWKVKKSVSLRCICTSHEWDADTCAARGDESRASTSESESCTSAVSSLANREMLGNSRLRRASMYAVALR